MPHSPLVEPLMSAIDLRTPNVETLSRKKARLKEDVQLFNKEKQAIAQLVRYTVAQVENTGDIKGSTAQVKCIRKAVRLSKTEPVAALALFLALAHVSIDESNFDEEVRSAAQIGCNDTREIANVSRQAGAKRRENLLERTRLLNEEVRLFNQAVRKAATRNDVEIVPRTTKTVRRCLFPPIKDDTHQHTECARVV